ncbi:hypothetical protein ESZ50_04705 [Weissella muntiaci]|uniref:Uncharacterized protein n=1 Tax=Weissella muntiaci TaxID=2508881 RepID=A0A6C2CA20_9LACO|nr:hypothetical protein [Weissella muntiaci]TYC49895.1 hypothetical protein ESZ50_04705 [Weissella muntiaci]
MTEQNETIGTLVTPEAGQAPAATVPTTPATPTAPSEPVDQLLQTYRDNIAKRGETGGLRGQIKEINVQGKPVIFTHPGIRKAMEIIAAGNMQSYIANPGYVDTLIKTMVSYPEEIRKEGLDYFDDHVDMFEELVGAADEFLGKFVN